MRDVREKVGESGEISENRGTEKPAPITEGAEWALCVAIWQP